MWGVEDVQAVLQYKRMQQNQNPILDERWLQIASFWTTYRERIRSGLIIFYLVVVGSIFLYGLYLAFNMWVLTSRDYAQSMRDLTTFPDYTSRHSVIAPQLLPAPIAVVLPESATDGAYDVLLRFSNPNPQWIANVEFEYGEGDRQVVRVLNGDERLVVVKGAATTLGAVPTISVVDVDWRRVRDLERFNSLKPDLVTDEVSYSSTEGPSRVAFTLNNNSIYSYWDVSLLVALLQGDRAVAARQVQVSQLLSNEEREVVVNFFGGVGGVTDVLVVPFVDVWDEKVFMKVDIPQVLQ